MGFGPDQCSRCGSLIPIGYSCRHCMASNELQSLIGDQVLPSPTEADPHGLDAHTPGAKVDAGKPFAGLLGLFGRALLAVAEVSTAGAKKYTRGGWQHVPEGETRYTDALWRHLLQQGGDISRRDPQLGTFHMAQVVWNALAALELHLRNLEGEHERTKQGGDQSGSGEASGSATSRPP